VTWAVSVLLAQDQLHDIPLTHPAIRYDQSAEDPVSVLVRRPERLIAMVSTGQSGYLRSILDVLNIPVESQILVFSKGSLQSSLIHAGNPRALYFNDSVVLGWVRGGIIEIAAQDPVRGTIFYTANPSQPFAPRRSDATCVSCHFSRRTQDVPGMIESMRHTLPLSERWGGWYVTGNLGALRHYGNVPDFARRPDARGGALPSLEKTFDAGGYLTPHSDVAALLVFEHQMQMMNLLARLGWEARVAIHERRLDAKGTALTDWVEQVVDYMLFVDEATIPNPLQGSSAFARIFSARGPRDDKGRSLYQLDLTRRVLRHPCSYMIYSAQFTQLPEPARAAVYQRLWTVLSGAEKAEKYRHLSLADRQAVVDILRATKPDLPAYFQAVAQ
jgi:hypothetical protein